MKGGEKLLNNILKFSVDKMELINEVNKSQFAKVKLFAFASGDNAHERPVSEETLKRSAYTIYSKPLVWFYDKYTDDAEGHNPLEIPCGFVHKEENPIEFVRLEDGRLMLTVEAMIWKRYSGKILSLFERDGMEKPVSVEIQILEEKENEDGKMEIVDLCYMAITILGTFVTPAIKSAKAEIMEFSIAKNEFDNLNFGKYDDLDFTIPNSVKNNAQKGLDLRKEYNRGGTSVGIATARYIVKNSIISPEKARQIAKYFPRHANDNLDEDGKDGTTVSNGYIAWMLWGGDSGRKWSTKLVESMNKKDEETMSYFAFNNESISNPIDNSEIIIDIDKNKDNIDNKKEVQEVIVEAVEKFSLNSNQIREILSNALSQYKYKNGDYEYIKYWVNCYDEDFVYVEDNEDYKNYQVKYSISDMIATIDLESKVEVIRGGFVPVGENKEEMASDANTEATAQAEMNNKESENNKELTEEGKEKMSDEKEDKEDFKAKYEQMCNKYQEMTEKYEKLNKDMSTYMSENEELKKFKADMEEKEKMSKVEYTLSEVMESVPKEKMEEMREDSKNFSLENLSVWENKVKAEAFVFSKEKIKDLGFTNIGLPFSGKEDKKVSSIWDKI